VIALAIVLPIAAGVGALHRFWPRFQEEMSRQRAREAAQRASDGVRDSVRADILSLAEAAEAYRQRANAPPPSPEALYASWSYLHPNEPMPRDPYHGVPYGYFVEGEHYVIHSAGADLDDPGDDIGYSSAAAAGP
jgi:hypothetical protein